MDGIRALNQIKDIFDKYKYVALVLLLGIFLMVFPCPKESRQSDQDLNVKPETDIISQLEDILSKTEGVGKVNVLVTEAIGAETIYQTDEDRRSDSVQLETVIISGVDRGEYGLVRQENPPTYRGALIVCEGADRPSVRLAVIEAVSSITGIPSDRITVLKMK